MKVEAIESNRIRRTEKFKKKRYINDSLLVIIFLIAFTLTILTQIAMYIPAFKQKIFTGDPNEGLPISSEEYLYHEGYIELKLDNGENCPALKVLVNGEERDSFLENTVKLDLIDGDVLEIDSSDTQINYNIIVSQKSSNISNEYLDKTFLLSAKLTRLFKINI